MPPAESGQTMPTNTGSGQPMATSRVKVNARKTSPLENFNLRAYMPCELLLFVCLVGLGIFKSWGLSMVNR